MRVDLEQLDLSVLALAVDDSSLTGGGLVGGGHDRDTFASSGSANGALGVIVGRPRSLGGRPSRSPALFVAPGHLGTGPSSPPSSYSTHSESGFGSPTRRLASPGPGIGREVGRVRKGHWKKGKPIGVGSCGNVYLGMNDDTGELMAVKEITLEARERLLCSLYNEIQVMHKLIHPHIVGYLGAELQDSQRKLCIFQEWVPAGSLHSLLDQFGALSDAMTRKYTGQVLEGLAYLHAHRVIHRDVKSKNILVDDRGNVKLADFGCALVLKDDNSGGEGVEMSMKGTPLFMAPEMLLKRKCGRRVDIWSLGCAVLEMVTTRPPWADAFKHPIEIIAHFNENPGPPPLPTDLGPGLRNFLLQCFTWDPEVRPSASELCAHGYLQNRGLPTDGAEGSSPADDVPLEEMDRVSAVTRMRRCSSATLDLLAVQARQAALGVGIGGALAAFGTAPSGTFRPPSPRYGPGGAAAHKRTPTRRRMPPPEAVPEVTAGASGSQQQSKGFNQQNTQRNQQNQGGQSSSSSGGGEGGSGSNTSPVGVDEFQRRNYLRFTRSPPLSPDKSRELTVDKSRASNGHKPGRGCGGGGFGGVQVDEDVRIATAAATSGRPGRGSGGSCVEDEGRISGPIPSRLRGPGFERSSGGGEWGHAVETGAATTSFFATSSSAGGVGTVPTQKGSTLLSAPREYEELLGVTLVGASGVVDIGPASDTPPPVVRPLEHPANASGRGGEVAWSIAAGVGQGPAPYAGALP